MDEQPVTRDRDGFVDVVRIAAVLVVVGGHWLTTTVIWDDTRITIENALSVIPDAHVVTWVLQVMPLLFFAGGFANARSLDLHGGSALAFSGFGNHNEGLGLPKSCRVPV